MFLGPAFHATLCKFLNMFTTFNWQQLVFKNYIKDTWLLIVILCLNALQIEIS